MLFFWLGLGYGPTFLAWLALDLAMGTMGTMRLWDYRYYGYYGTMGLWDYGYGGRKVAWLDFCPLLALAYAPTHTCHGRKVHLFGLVALVPLIWTHPYICRVKSPYSKLRPYTPKPTTSRPICEVKQVMAESVLWWGTTWEYYVL